MEATTPQAFLRVLYTVNSSPQYILAKSSSQVPVITCTGATPQHVKGEPVYARTSLKACLAAVRDSSPELLQDPARDFSLYVLDPLEAQPLPPSLAHAPHDNNSPRGVAVALGLMTWALESNDSTNVFVTGTILPHASPALEVVLALRETKRMPRPIFHSYPSLGSLSASQLPNPPHPPQAAGMNWLSTCQEQQTLTCSTDFPELYIGPPRRARGRPEGSTSSRSKVTPQTRTSSLPGASSSNLVETQFESKREAGRRSKQKTKTRPPRAPPKYSPFVCAPLTRHAATREPEGSTTGVPAFHQQSHSLSQNQTHSHSPHPQPQLSVHPTHNSLLRLLSAILSPPSGNITTNTTPEQQTALLSALQLLFAANPHLLQPATTNVGLSASSGEQATEKEPMHKESSAGDEHDDGDSDIVILDSSAIDTAAFCKPSTWQLSSSDQDTFTTNQESPMPSSQRTDSSPLPASTPPSGQENALASQNLTPKPTPEIEIPTSEGSPRRENVAAFHALDMPATPTPSRTRKRKQGEYIQDQVHLSTPTSSFSFSPSPSPSVTRTSSSGRGLTARQRVQFSPTGGSKSVSLPSARLSSMLGSMRATTTSGSRPQVSVWGSSTHRHPASLPTNKSGNQSIPLIIGPSKLKTGHPGVTDASLNGIASDTMSLKRRRTLNEFMAEHEARKSTKVRKRSSSGRKLEADISANASQTTPRSAKLVSTANHARSSSPRPIFRSDSLTFSLLSSTCQPDLVPGAAIPNLALSSTTTLACAAPSTSFSTAAPAKNPLKNFVLPAWARTNTAMLPRLSEEVLARQRAEREAKKAQASLRRREAAKVKRKQPHGAEQSSKESSDDDGEAVASDANLRTLHSSSSVAWSAPSLSPPLPSLPVFASDTVEPIPSSPPRSHRQLVPPVTPSTPPRKSTSSGLAPYCTPSKSGSCSLFTPSGQDSGSLFTPNTPSVTRSVTFTPRSPTGLHGSGTRKSLRKDVSQTPRTPELSGGNHQTSRSLHTGRSPRIVSPSLAIHTPQTRTGRGTRAFLLPPPSPCALPTPRLQKQRHSKVPGGSTPITSEDGMFSCEPDDAILGEDMPIPPPKWSPSGPTVDDGQRTGEPCDMTSNGDTSPAEVEYASSPLPPSSPLPFSAFSSPAKHHDSNFNTPIINNLVVPDSDALLPSASDSDGSQGTVRTTWLSDDACIAPWVTDSEASAWLTETEEGRLPTDSDAAWLSDSDAVFGDMSPSFPSSASNWLSDDADVDTDCELGAMEGRDCRFDVAAFERAFAALLEHGGRSSGKEEAGTSEATTHGTVQSQYWESILGGNAVNEVDAAYVDVNEPVDEKKMAQDNQELLGGIVGA